MCLAEGQNAKPESELPEGIPSLDFSEFTSGDENRKAKFVADLGKAYEDIGFVALKNLGISDELTSDLYEKIQKFFTMEKDMKTKYEVSESGGQRGYTSLMKEHAKGSKFGDLKEFWHFGQYVEDGDAIAEEYPKNLSVSEVDGFDATGKKTYKALEDAGKGIMQAIAIYLDLDEHYFDKPLHNGNSILRPIHYPPIPEEGPASSVRAGAHEDINLITLLIGASADGLQVQNKEGEWVSVTALPGHIVVNVGDMLQRLTNGRLKSTTHRVQNPPKELWGTSRYSIPFFLHPRGDMSLNALTSCFSDKKPKAFEDITAGEYLNQRLREIGLIK